MRRSARRLRSRPRSSARSSSSPRSRSGATSIGRRTTTSRAYGFRQVFAENGGPGSLFHGLRAMRAMVPIARAMERICPDAVLLNYTNPMHKVCDAITTLSKIQCVGLCHGVWMGMEQVAYFVDKAVYEMEMEACGINHFSSLQTIRDRRTGDELYPQLRAAERQGVWLADSLAV